MLNWENAGNRVQDIQVPISREIIQLFSEGLYKSPHKAVEELVTNAYDAHAQNVHILLPETELQEGSHDSQRLWVIDNGEGMDQQGFQQLWRIAESRKTHMPERNGHAPIGQFGIGKLASYVLARRLTHWSCVRGQILMTSMDFNKVTGHHQADAPDPISIALWKVDEAMAREHLAEIEGKDSIAWTFMFGPERAASWTAAALSDFKDLYNRLQAGRLRWVLRTGLPLHANFQIWLGGQRLQSSKTDQKPLKTFPIEETLPEIGCVKGSASIYGEPLTRGKSEHTGRSHGFFVRVRGRVINLDDELFGMEAQNHAAWSRFVLEVHADGLREHLLSSRESVRDSDAVRKFQAILLAKFRACRSAYDKWHNQTHMDVQNLLGDKPSTHICSPLLRSVRSTLETGCESFYIDAPRNLAGRDKEGWLVDFEGRIRDQPFADIQLTPGGQNAPVLQYWPDRQELIVNVEHPFIDKLGNTRNQQNLAQMFASSEAVLEGQLEEHGISRPMIVSLLEDRDRVLRLIAGDAIPTAQEVIQRLENASNDPAALERATGAVFQLLGFLYERKGGNTSGPDGVLYVRLGLHQEDRLANYKLVYDAKQINSPSVPADKVNLSSLNDFRKTWEVDYGLFIAEKYQGEDQADSKLNRQLAAPEYRHLTLLKVDHLRQLVRLHTQYGITPSELHSLFEKCRTVGEVSDWLSALEKMFIQQGKVSLSLLLRGLENEKSDQMSLPNIAVVRSKNNELMKYPPERLVAVLKALEGIVGTRWLEVDEHSFTVVLHQTDQRILDELERRIRIDEMSWLAGS